MKKEEKTKISRDKILQSALKMFGEIGYDNFTINALCKEYHISKGLLYHNFSGKEELFLHCVDRCYHELLESLREGSQIPTIKIYIQRRLRFFKENPELSRIYFESLIQVNERLAREVHAIRKRLTDFNKQVYENFISSANLRSGVDEQEAVEYFELVQKMLNAYYSSPAIRGDRIDFLENEHEDRLEKFLEFMLYGVAEALPAP